MMEEYPEISETNVGDGADIEDESVDPIASGVMMRL